MTNAVVYIDIDKEINMNTDDNVEGIQLFKLSKLLEEHEQLQQKLTACQASTAPTGPPAGGPNSGVQAPVGGGPTGVQAPVGGPNSSAVPPPPVGGPNSSAVPQAPPVAPPVAGPPGPPGPPGTPGLPGGRPVAAATVDKATSEKITNMLSIFTNTSKPKKKARPEITKTVHLDTNNSDEKAKLSNIQIIDKSLRDTMNSFKNFITFTDITLKSSPTQSVTGITQLLNKLKKKYKQEEKTQKKKQIVTLIKTFLEKEENVNFFKQDSDKYNMTDGFIHLVGQRLYDLNKKLKKTLKSWLPKDFHKHLVLYYRLFIQWYKDNGKALKKTIRQLVIKTHTKMVKRMNIIHGYTTTTNEDEVSVDYDDDNFSIKQYYSKLMENNPKSCVKNLSFLDSEIIYDRKINIITDEIYTAITKGWNKECIEEIKAWAGDNLADTTDNNSAGDNLAVTTDNNSAGDNLAVTTDNKSFQYFSLEKVDTKIQSGILGLCNDLNISINPKDWEEIGFIKYTGINQQTDTDFLHNLINNYADKTYFQKLSIKDTHQLWYMQSVLSDFHKKCNPSETLVVGFLNIGRINTEWIKQLVNIKSCKDISLDYYPLSLKLFWKYMFTDLDLKELQQIRKSIQYLQLGMEPSEPSEQSDPSMEFDKEELNKMKDKAKQNKLTFLNNKNTNEDADITLQNVEDLNSKWLFKTQTTKVEEMQKIIKRYGEQDTEIEDYIALEDQTRKVVSKLLLEFGKVIKIIKKSSSNMFEQIEKWERKVCETKLDEHETNFDKLEMPSGSLLKLVRRESGDKEAIKNKIDEELIKELQKKSEIHNLVFEDSADIYKNYMQVLTKEIEIQKTLFKENNTVNDKKISNLLKSTKVSKKLLMKLKNLNGP